MAVTESDSKLASPEAVLSNAGFFRGERLLSLKHYRFIDYATQIYVALVGLMILGFHGVVIPKWPWFVAVHAVCVGGIHVLIQLHASRMPRPAPGLDFLRNFYPVILYAAFYRETGEINQMFITGFFDSSLIEWEARLFGFQPSLELMSMMPHVVVSELLYASYFSYYAMIFGVGMALYMRDRDRFLHYIAVVSFVFYVCYLIYIVLPVVGPPIFYGKADGYQLPPAAAGLWHLPEIPATVQSGPFFQLMKFIYTFFEAPGAALPSSHVAVALCTLYFSGLYLPRIRLVHAVVALLLCISTVYCRYHYALDVFAGALTAVVLIPIANWLYFRFRGE